MLVLLASFSLGITVSNSGAYDTVSATKYKMDIIVDPSATDFGETTNCYSNDYNSSQVLRSSSEGHCIFMKVYKSSFLSGWDTLGSALGGGSRYFFERGPYRVKEVLTYSSGQVNITYYLYDEFFVQRFTSHNYTGDYNDGFLEAFAVDDLTDVKGPDSWGLKYAEGSDTTSPIDTSQNTGGTTSYDTFSLGNQVNWTTWYSNESSGLTLGGIYPPIVPGASDSLSDIYDREDTSDTYDQFEVEQTEDNAYGDADFIAGIYQYGAGNTNSTTKSLYIYYTNPAKMTCIDNCKAAGFDRMEFIYEVTPTNNTDQNQTEFMVTGNPNWISNEPIYFKVYNANKVEIWKSTDGQNWTEYLNASQVQNNDGYIIFKDFLNASETEYYLVRRTSGTGIPSSIVLEPYPLPLFNRGDNVAIDALVLDKYGGIVNDSNVTGSSNNTQTTLTFNSSTQRYEGNFSSDDWAPGVYKFTGYANKSIPVDLTNQTCSGYWGFDCGYGPPETGDNTFDSCPTGTGNDENVIEMWLNATTVHFNDTVQVTCKFDTYDTANDQEYIWYYNGTNWTKLWDGDVGDNVVANKTVNFTVTGDPGTQWVRCSISYDPQDQPCQDSGSYYDNDDLPFTAEPKYVNISSDTYYHIYPGAGVSIYSMNWEGSNKTFLENKHIAVALENSRNLVFNTLQKDSANQYTWKGISYPDMTRLYVSPMNGTGNVTGISEKDGENQTYGLVNISESITGPTHKKVCFVCYTAGSPDSTYELPYINFLEKLGYTVDYNTSTCNYSASDIQNKDANFSGYDFWAHSYIYDGNGDITEAKTYYVDQLANNELILGPDTTYLYDFGYATTDDKDYYPRSNAYVTGTDGFLPKEDYSTGEDVKLTNIDSGYFQYESHRSDLISDVKSVLTIGGENTEYVSSGVYENKTTGGKMVYMGLAEDAIQQITNYSDSEDNGYEIMSYFTNWLGKEASLGINIKLKDEDDDYFIWNTTNFSSGIGNYTNLGISFSGSIGGTSLDDRLHIENGSDWQISDLQKNSWVEIPGNYTSVYDNGTTDSANNVTIGLVNFPQEQANLYYWSQENTEGSRIDYDPSNLSNTSVLEPLVVFTLGDFESIDQWILTIEHGEYPIPNFMTVPAISWNKTQTTIITDAGHSNSTNVSLGITGWQDNINISIVEGNATDSSGNWFISSSPSTIDLGTGNYTINITCDPPSNQPDGTYYAVFNAKSKRNKIGSNITVYCQVGTVQTKLAWNVSSQDLGSVLQAYSNSSNAKLTATNDNTNVILEQLSGNATFIKPNITFISDLNSTSQNITFTCKPYPWTEPGNYSAVWNARSDQYPDGDNITVYCNVSRAKQIVVVYTDGTWDIFPFNLDDWVTGTGTVQQTFPYTCGTTSGNANVYYYNITVNPNKIIDKVVFSDNSTDQQQITAVTLEKS